jgi:hypothetical protein
LKVTVFSNGSALAIAIRLATAVGVPPELVHELHRLHARQWRLEDETRAPGASSDVIAAAKADIDRSNARRHRLIDRIDAIASRPIPTEPSRCYSETVGELCDRLLILDLKHGALSGEGGTGAASADDRPANGGLGAGSIEHLSRHLATVVTQLIDDLAASRASLPPRVGVKIYNGSTRPDGGEVRARLAATTRSASTVGG